MSGKYVGQADDYADLGERFRNGAKTGGYCNAEICSANSGNTTWLVVQGHMIVARRLQDGTVYVYEDWVDVDDVAARVIHGTNMMLLRPKVWTRDGTPSLWQFSL